MGFFRWEAYDRNADFGQTVEPEAFNMDLPDPGDYKDINSQSEVIYFSTICIHCMCAIPLF